MNRRPSQTPRSGAGERRTRRYRTTPADEFRPSGLPPRRVLARALKLAGLVLLLALAANAALNRFVLVRRVSVPVPRLDPSLDGRTLLQISDLKGAQFGAGQRRLLARLTEPADAVVLTGDMVSPQGNPRPLYELLDGLREAFPGVPVYLIAGDADPEPVSQAYAAQGSCYAAWVLGARQRGARLLSAPVRVGDGSPALWLVPGDGLTLDVGLEQARFRALLEASRGSGGGVLGELAAFHLRRLDGFAAARTEITADDLCVAVMHAAPEAGVAERELAGAPYPVDALLSGHWLGGLVRIPGAGPLFIPSPALPRYGLFPGEGFGGLSRVAGIPAYVSCGLGAGDAQYPAFFFRLFNPPSVTYLHFIASGV